MRSSESAQTTVPHLMSFDPQPPAWITIPMPAACSRNVAKVPRNF